MQSALGFKKEGKSSLVVNARRRIFGSFDLFCILNLSS